MEYRASQSRGEYDFDLYHADGAVSAVEVTSSVDQTLRETDHAITDGGKGGDCIPATLCKNGWYLIPDKCARIKRLRKDADCYLAAIENAGIAEFSRGDERPTVAAICKDLGVIRGSIRSWVGPGKIIMLGPIVGGAVGVSTVLEAAEQEALKTDNRRKLGAATSAERHLAVYVSIRTRAWPALSDFDPQPEIPNLPPEVTNIWMFSESYENGEYVFWRAGSTLPWTKGRLALNT